MAQAVLAGDGAEVIEQTRAEADAAPRRIDHPLHAADEAERSAVAAMQGGVGDDLVAIDREQRKDFRVVDVLSPALDQLAMIDRIPREAAVRDRQVLKELVQPVDVSFGE